MNKRRDQHILVVDDEAVNLKLLERMLGLHGYTSLSLVQDSRNVVEAYQRRKPDLILLDVNMPCLDGYQVIEQLKSLDDPLLPPIIMLTAQNGREYVFKALSLGARDFIAKPFDQTELLMRVRNLLDAHLAHKLLAEQKDVLEAEVRSRTRELYESRLEIIRFLGRAAEYRDNETGLHIVRMSQYSVCLGKAAGMGEEEAEMLLNASPMHDIGKIGISDRILQKPGKLDASEYQIMKKHAEIGADILSGHPSPLMQMAATIALTHHEKWDGSGYPQGLAGEGIPLVGRVVALCDVFDALTSNRPYKKAWSSENALGYIAENSASHFDPCLVKTFESIVPEILAIRERHAEQNTRSEVSELL